MVIWVLFLIQRQAQPKRMDLDRWVGDVPVHCQVVSKGVQVVPVYESEVKGYLPDAIPRVVPPPGPRVVQPPTWGSDGTASAGGDPRFVPPRMPGPAVVCPPEPKQPATKPLPLPHI